MFALPEGEDLSFLREAEVELVCFAAYQVNIHFQGGVLVTIFGLFDHIVSEMNTPSKNTGFPLRSSELMRLLGDRVTRFQTESDATLLLWFSNGDQLVIKGDNGPYESYHIKKGDKIIIV